MKKTSKGVLILLACVAVFGLGFGIRVIVDQRNMPAKAVIDEQPVYAIEDGEPGLPVTTAVEPAERLTSKALAATSEPIEAGMDLKRGSFLTSEIMVQLNEFTAEETIGGVWVGASRIVHGDTRAFVKVCMALEGSSERLMFGGPTWLNYPGGKSNTFFVHNDVPDEGDAACEILEFVGVSSEGQGDWRFTMENVSYTIPDEGTECDVYQERANADQSLQEAGIAVACSHGEGGTALEIASKPADLSEAEAEEMLQTAVIGRHHGPWIFDLLMEPGLIQPNL